jgi:hypothetical protein
LVVDIQGQVTGIAEKRMASLCKGRTRPKVAGTGFEPYTENATNSSRLTQSGADSGALNAPEAPIDSDLAMLIDAWPMLSESIKAVILALVRSVGWSG